MGRAAGAKGERENVFFGKSTSGALWRYLAVPEDADAPYSLAEHPRPINRLRFAS